MAGFLFGVKMAVSLDISKRMSRVRPASGGSQGRKLIVSCACSQLRQGRDSAEALLHRDRGKVPLFRESVTKPTPAIEMLALLLSVIIERHHKWGKHA